MNTQVPHTGGLDLRRACDLTPVPLDWLWCGRLAFGKLALIEGDPGLGKSLLTLDLCARLSRGRPMPQSEESSAPANSLVLNAEDGEGDTIRSRLIALDADLERVFVVPGNSSSIRLPGRCDVLDEAIARTAARLVVLDPLLAFFDYDVSAGNDQSVRRAIAPLANLASRHGCCVLLVRHLNKHGSKQAIYRGGGAIGLLGACRSAWLVGRDPVVPGRCVLAQVKNNLAAAQGSLCYRVISEGGTPRLVWLGESVWSAEQVLSGTVRGASRVQARALLWSFLDGGPRLVREIWAEGEKQGLSARTLQRARRDLSIASRRLVGDGKCECYWLLPGQELPGQGSGDLEPWLGPLREKYPSATPLEE